MTSSQEIIDQMMGEYPHMISEQTLMGIPIIPNSDDDCCSADVEEIDEDNNPPRPITVGSVARKFHSFIRNLENWETIKIAEECPNLEVLAIESKGADINLFDMVKRMPNLRDLRLRSDSGRAWEDAYIIGDIPSEKVRFPNMTHIHFEWIGQYDSDESQDTQSCNRGADNYSYYQQTVDTIIAFVCSCPNLTSLVLPTSWKPDDKIRANKLILTSCPLLPIGVNFFYNNNAYPYFDFANDLHLKHDVIHFCQMEELIDVDPYFVLSDDDVYDY